MLRFEFHLERPQHLAMSIEPVFEKKLNDDWKIQFNWNPFPRPLPQFIQICRETAAQEILVTGTLTHRARGRILKVEEIFKMFKPGTLFITMDLYEATTTYETRTVDGVIYIAPTSEVINGGCKNCSKGMALEKLSNDMEKLLDPQYFWYSDVNLKCGDEVIPAHKLILSTRSPVFAAMFANEMKENSDRQVHITDMDPDVVRSMIIFIYTGKTPGLTIASATHLLYASEKYQMEDLKRLCTDFMKENVSLENVLTMIDLGHALSEDLKFSAIEYFCNTCTNFFEFEKSEEWETFKVQRTDLAMDIMASLLKFRDQQGPHVF